MEAASNWKRCSTDRLSDQPPLKNKSSHDGNLVPKATFLKAAKPEGVSTAGGRLKKPNKPQKR